MELAIFERVVLLSILPPEGNFLTLKIVRKLREDLSFTEEEHKELDFKNPGDTYINDELNEVIVAENRIHWNPNAPQVKEFELGATAITTVADALKKLDKENKLTEQHISLYEKFVEAQ